MKKKSKKLKKKPVKAPQKKRTPKSPEKKLDPNIECIYEKEITFMCPVRGLVTQKVLVKKYKSKQVQAKEIIKSKEDEIVESEEVDTTLMDNE